MHKIFTLLKKYDPIIAIALFSYLLLNACIIAASALLLLIIFRLARAKPLHVIVSAAIIISALGLFTPLKFSIFTNELSEAFKRPLEFPPRARNGVSYSLFQNFSLTFQIYGSATGMLLSGLRMLWLDFIRNKVKKQ